MSHFSFSCFRRPMRIIIEQETIPATDNARMIHLSRLDAWRIKLSTQARRKKINITSHADIQYLETECLIMVVKHIPEIVQSRALKIKGGSMKINWKRLNTITTADNAGYFNTTCPGKSLLSMFCVPNFRFRLRRKTMETITRTNKRMSFARSFRI